MRKYRIVFSIHGGPRYFSGINCPDEADYCRLFLLRTFKRRCKDPTWIEPLGSAIQVRVC